MTQLKPILVKRRLNNPVQPFIAEITTRELAEQGVKAGTVIKVDHDVYEEVEVNVYQTKVMEPEKKVVRKKAVTRKDKSKDE